MELPVEMINEIASHTDNNTFLNIKLCSKLLYKSITHPAIVIVKKELRRIVSDDTAEQIVITDSDESRISENDLSKWFLEPCFVEVSKAYKYSYNFSKCYDMEEILQFEKENNIILPGQLKEYLVKCCKSLNSDIFDYINKKECDDFMKTAKIYPGDFTKYLRLNSHNNKLNGFYYSNCEYEGLLRIAKDAYMVLNGKHYGSIWHSSCEYEWLYKIADNLYSYIINKMEFVHKEINLSSTEKIQRYAISYNLLRVFSSMPSLCYTN